MLKIGLFFRLKVMFLTPKMAAPGIPMGPAASWIPTGLKLQSGRKKLILTTKPALAIQVDIIYVKRRFNNWGCS
jgi:hypothetical protein